MPQFSRAELDELIQISRRLKKETGDKLMLSSPDLFSEMEAFWYITSNAITKSKIRAFLLTHDFQWDDPLA